MLEHSAYLSIYEQNARYRLSRLLPEVAGGAANFGSLLEVCRLYRIAGVAAFFLNGDVAALWRDLRKSALTCAAGLANVSSDEYVVSQLRPFFDAIAAGDMTAACRIAERAAGCTHSQLEYEEDFLFTRCIMQHSCPAVHSNDATELLDRFEVVAGPIEDSRYGLCRAFIDGDNFALHLEAFLEQHLDRMSNIAASGRMLPEQAATEVRFSVEGAALVRLGRAAGSRLDRDYPGVPSMAIIPPHSEPLEADWLDPYN